MTTIDYKALAERIEERVNDLDAIREALRDKADLTDDPAADLRTVVSLLNGMAQEKPAMWMQSDHVDIARRSPFMARCAPTQLQPDYVPLYAHPAPNEPQAELAMVAWLNNLMGEHDFTIPLKAYRAIVRKLAAPQAEPKREPATDAILAACNGTRERAAKACEALAFLESNSHWSDGFNTAIERCAAAIRALGGSDE